MTIANIDPSCNALQEAIQRRTVEVARRLGLSTSTVSKWQEPSGDWSDSGALNPLDRLESLIDFALERKHPGAFAPIKWLAHRFGFALIKLPDQKEHAHPATETLVKSIHEFAQYADAVSSGLADGRLTPEERRKIHREAMEAVEAILALMKCVDFEEMKS